jgi:hypothetical protein
MNPSHDFYAVATHCAFAASFIRFAGEPDWPFGFPDSGSFIIRTPPRPKRRRRISRRKRTTVYSAMNIANEYVDQTQDALRAGDDGAARSALEVLFSIIAVALKSIGGECLPNTSERLQ